MHSLKEKIEWLLKGGYLIDIGKERLYAYGLDLNTNTFYAISHYRVGETKPTRFLEKHILPLIDIKERMAILIEY